MLTPSLVYQGSSIAHMDTYRRASAEVVMYMYILVLKIKENNRNIENGLKGVFKVFFHKYSCPD